MRLQTQHAPLRRVLFVFNAIYVKEGVEELDQDKLPPLLRLRYNNAISDAEVDLGGAEQIRSAFVGFQKYLYQAAASTAVLG